MQLHKIDAVNRKAVSTSFGALSKWIAVLRLVGKGSPITILAHDQDGSRIFSVGRTLATTDPESAES
ncbi:hypothetical protein NL676_038917 [Syzygium grande]|nr:hypothetical protein NL676_038917 [Syzygium grande]